MDHRAILIPMLLTDVIKPVLFALADQSKSISTTTLV